MTLNADNIVKILPGVVSGGGNPLSLNGVVLDESSQIPAGSVLQFASLPAVQNYFGSGSSQANIAKYYFTSYTNSTRVPGILFFAPYAAAARSAEILGGSLAGVTLTQLQAFSGTLTITIAGSGLTSSSINLASATSFSNAASIIEAAFTSPGFTISWSAQQAQFIVTSTATGAAETITFASGSIAADLGLTQATGAVLSQGVVADTPATAMANVIANTRNWASFMTNFEPDTADKLSFAAWLQTQNQKYAYIAYDSDANTIVANASTTFGAQVIALEDNGVFAISGEASVAAAAGSTVAQMAQNVAAFVMGYIASVNFNQTNGRTTAAFRSQAGLAANVVNDQAAANLIGNGYNFYGAYATANQNFVFLYNGQISGQYEWLDTYIDQIFLNSQFQLAFLTYMTSVNSIPYNQTGYTGIKETAAGPINQALKAGIIRTGVTLSAAEILEVNTAAGLAIDTTLTTQGWYLQVLDPGSNARGARTTPTINFWYTDGSAVQQLTVASIDVQ